MKHTTIATKINIKSDIAPGMVKIISGQEMELYGARNIFEALTYVPGIQTYTNNIGDPNVSIRGIGGRWFIGNLKLMLNGENLNDSIFSGGYAAYGIPVELVEKIEIIRGPGSVLYGKYAYAGVVNIVLRQKSNQLFALTDQNDTIGAGYVFSHNQPEKNIAFNIHAYQYTSKGPSVNAGTDRLHEMGFGAYSNSPGSTNEARKDHLLNVHIKIKDFIINANSLLHSRGEHFGYLNILPRPEDRVDIKHKNRNIQALYTLKATSGLKFDFKIGQRKYVFSGNRWDAMPEIDFVLADGMVMSPEGGLYASPYYEERETYENAELIYTGINRHSILGGVEYADVEAGDIWVVANSDPDNFGVEQKLTGDKNWIMGSPSRVNLSVYLQDVISLTERFSLTVGLRYDHYNNTTDGITPRASAVYHWSHRHILKAQYSETIRPPTFYELYSGSQTLTSGNSDLEVEKVKSYEAGYLFQLPQFKSQVSVYLTEVFNRIEYPMYADTFSGMNNQYENVGLAQSMGAEFEFETEISEKLNIDGNLSYVDTENKSTGKPLADAVEWMGNMRFLMQPIEDVNFALRYLYVGKRHRAPDDPRDKLKAYDTVDLTTTWRVSAVKGIVLSAGIKNVADSDIRYSSPVYKGTDGVVGFNYYDDLARPGREIWFKVAYHY